MPSPDETRINQQLEAFAQDPVAFMNQQPPKHDVQTGETETPQPFSTDMVTSGDFISAHDRQRQKIFQPEGAIGARAGIVANDKAENLVDTFRYDHLDEIENAGLMSAALDESPWSDDYWGIYKGILGARYADPDFPADADWKVNFDYVRAHPPAAILGSGSSTRINRLSPAEKYDALVGDGSESLTRYMWAEGKRYYDAHGEVESWMGICHGWSPASYMLARPTRAILLKTPDNVHITFYPSDIKALASLLWANAAPRTRFIGGRCQDKEPATDPQTGRITSDLCFDTNPGTWHLAVVNQIGVSRRGMVMDVTYDYEVWNQPVYAYSYRYFNPQTQAYQATLAAATVPMANYSADKFKAFRSHDATHAVGIQMTVSYVVETRPSQREEDSPAHDAIQSVDYYYDLELDASGKIIGGEWYLNKHPDFLWTPGKNMRAQTRYDSQATGEWRKNEAVPQGWRNIAKSAASTQGAPLAAIVEHLIRFANEESGAAPRTMNNDERPVPPTSPDATPQPASPSAPDTTSPADEDDSTGPDSSTTSPGGNQPPVEPATPDENPPAPPADSRSWFRRMLNRWFS